MDREKDLLTKLEGEALDSEIRRYWDALVFRINEAADAGEYYVELYNACELLPYTRLRLKLLLEIKGFKYEFNRPAGYIRVSWAEPSISTSRFEMIMRVKYPTRIL